MLLDNSKEDVSVNDWSVNVNVVNKGRSNKESFQNTYLIRLQSHIYRMSIIQLQKQED